MKAIAGALGWLVWVVGVYGGTGCTGDVLDEGSSAAGLAKPAAPWSPAASAPDARSAPMDSMDTVAGTCMPGRALPTTRSVRITHAQYDNTVRMLTGLDVHPSHDFPSDQNQAGFNRGIDLEVGEVLGQAYRSSAEHLAQLTVNDPGALAKVVGCEPTRVAACANTFVPQFGRRAFRRPLSDAERAAYAALLARGADLVDGPASPFIKGVQVVLEAMLQSPSFLYRFELGERVASDRVALSGYEMAARLAFALTDQAPDEPLLDAAAAGQLSSPDGVADAASRLLAMPQARAMVRDFHRQWLDLDALPNKLAKDPTKFPSVNPELAAVLAEESMRFAEVIAFDEKRGYRGLLTAPFAFVNRVTAPLYGLQGPHGESLERAAVDPIERAGIFTQVAFLAGRAYSDQSSPIHRGVFVQRKVLCNDIPDPPANTPQPPALGPTQTTRQQIDTLTSVSPCNGCHHTLINPVGFAFESYDAVGQHRREENGAPIDASGTLAGTRAANAGEGDFQDAVGASERIAESLEGRRCFAATWLRYTLGRQEDPSERCMLDTLAERLGDDRYTIPDLLIDLTRTTSFTSRTAEGS